MVYLKTFQWQFSIDDLKIQSLTNTDHALFEAGERSAKNNVQTCFTMLHNIGIMTEGLISLDFKEWHVSYVPVHMSTD